MAFDHYSRAIALDCSVPAVYTNRAIAAIHLKRYETAEDDCTRALDIDPTYLKALLRRGVARMHRGKYAAVCVFIHSSPAAVAISVLIVSICVCRRYLISRTH